MSTGRSPRAVPRRLRAVLIVVIRWRLLMVLTLMWSLWRWGRAVGSVRGPAAPWVSRGGHGPVPVASVRCPKVEGIDSLAFTSSLCGKDLSSRLEVLLLLVFWSTLNSSISGKREAGSRGLGIFFISAAIILSTIERAPSK